MSYSLSFAEDFFSGTPDGEIGSDDIRKLYPVTRRPQNVVQALVSNEYYCPRTFRRMVKEILGYDLPKVDFKNNAHTPPGLLVDESVFYELLEAVKKYDTCDTLTPPIKVYLNEEHSVTVYEDTEEEVA